MKNNLEKKRAEIMMLCGVLHDIAEMAREENISRQVKTVQEKLENLLNDNKARPSPFEEGLG